jgi:hypothetical protein
MRHLWIPLFLSITLIVYPHTGLTAPDDWETVGNGIAYQEFHLPDPNNVFVARMDRSNPSLILDSGIAQGMLAHGTETVSDMARRYDGAINTWGGTWGASNKVVVAINGSFFYTPSGTPMSGQIISGWYAKRFDDLGGGSGLAWKMNRSMFIGKCVYHRPEKQLVTYIKKDNNNVTQRIDGVNIPRANNQLILYTPQFGVDTGTNDDGAEVVVELNAPAEIMPTPAMVRGTIRSIRDGEGSSTMYFDEVVISAQGTARDILLANAHVGDELNIGISQEVTHLDNECITRDPDSWTKTYASVSGSFELLLDGVVQSSDDPGATARHPRTAIAYNDDYIYFIVVDGRTQASIGMTTNELALFAKNTLGATWGLAQDGGGSSTMVVNGRVRNHPSNPCYVIYLPYINQGGQGEPGVLPSPPGPNGPGICQRKVANSMMMVEVEPEQKSGILAPYDFVRVTSPSAIRLGPGTNYPALDEAPSKAIGTVLSDMNDLNGVYAKGTYWWYVDFGRVIGWVDQETISYTNPLLMESSPFR